MSYLCHADAWRAMMGQHDGKTYRPWEPQRYQHEAHSPAAKLPEGDLVFFLLDTVPQSCTTRRAGSLMKAPRGGHWRAERA